MTHYKPKTEEQLAKEGLLPEGEYDFEIIECTDKPSKKGNAMYAMKLHVFTPDGNSAIVFDYIVFGTNMGERKYRHIAHACGLIADYEAGTLTNEDFVGRTGKAAITIQDGSAEYPNPKNIVKDYVKTDKKAAPKVEKPLDDDSIPF